MKSDTVQLSWATWSDVLAFCAHHAIPVTGGFLAGGIFHDKAPKEAGVTMAAKLELADGPVVMKEKEWLSADEAGGIAVLSDLEFRANFMPPAKTVPVVELDQSMPSLFNRTIEPGTSFRAVMDSVREGLEEAKRELGLL